MTSMITFHAPGSGQQHISEGADGYMAMIPFDEEYAVDWLTHLQDASYADITQVISKGFTVRFPEDTSVPSANDQQFSQECSSSSDLQQCRGEATRIKCSLPAAPLVSCQHQEAVSVQVTDQEGKKQ